MKAIRKIWLAHSNNAETIEKLIAAGAEVVKSKQYTSYHFGEDLRIQACKDRARKDVEVLVWFNNAQSQAEHNDVYGAKYYN